MNTAFDEALRLLEYAREEIQNCYGEDTDLTDRITCFLGLYEMNLKRSIGGKKGEADKKC